MARNKPCGHILLVRLSAMGDVAMCVPVAKALREAYPGVKITVLTRPLFQSFFRDIPGLDFILPDFGGRHKGLKGIWRLFRECLRGDIDCVADLHDVLRTKVLRRLLRLAGKRVSVIDKGRFDKRALTRKFRKFRQPLESTVERYYDTVRRLGFDFDYPMPAVHAPAAIPGAITEITGPKTGAWIGFAPFARHRGKIYPTNLSGELVELLAGAYEKVFIFGGGEHERDFATCMEQLYPGKVVAVIGRITLSQEMDLISNLDCVISMDSATMHIASLVGTPVVSVWGATHPYAGFYGFGQDLDDIVQLDLDCRPCSVYGDKHCMYGDYRCLAGIEPTVIVRKVERVMERNAPRN